MNYCECLCTEIKVVMSYNKAGAWSLTRFTFFSAAQPCSHNIEFFPTLGDSADVPCRVYLTYRDIFFSVSTTGEKTTTETLCVLATQSTVRRVSLLLIKNQSKKAQFFLPCAFYYWLFTATI